MKTHTTLSIILLLLTLTACTQPTVTPSATLPPPTHTQPAPSDTQTPIPPTITPSPTETLAPSETPTPLPAPILDSQGILMAYIPAGTFEMGNNSGYTDERPAHMVNLTQAFYMDVYEVTNASYAVCVAVGQCTPPFVYGGMESSSRESYYSDPEYADYPVVQVNWEQANTYCAWRGTRLPTEAEWEYAARGGLEGLDYPWGNSFDGEKANYCDTNCSFEHKNTAFDDGYADTAPTGSYAPNGYGIYGMAGNVWEWVSDWYSPDYYKVSSETNPGGPTNGEHRVVRGGSWQNRSEWLSVSFRVGSPPLSSDPLTGFRCVAPIDAQAEATP